MALHASMQASLLRASAARPAAAPASSSARPAALAHRAIARAPCAAPAPLAVPASAAMARAGITAPNCRRSRRAAVVTASAKGEGKGAWSERCGPRRIDGHRAVAGVTVAALVAAATAAALLPAQSRRLPRAPLDSSDARHRDASAATGSPRARASR